MEELLLSVKHGNNNKAKGVPSKKSNKQITKYFFHRKLFVTILKIQGFGSLSSKRFRASSLQKFERDLKKKRMGRGGGGKEKKRLQGKPEILKKKRWLNNVASNWSGVVALIDKYSINQ